MNVENILKVADAIEQHSIPELGFNMADVVSGDGADNSGRSCGTVACIAGYALALQHQAKSGPEALSIYYDTPAADMTAAAAWLGLPFFDSQELFFGRGAGTPMNLIKASHAVVTLRRLAATGEVDWSIGGPDADGD